MANLNLGDMSAFERMLYGNVEDDPELEAELLAIQNELGEDDDASIFINTPVRSNRPQASRSSVVNNPMADIERLAREISEEITVEDDDNDESVDDDPELLAELSAVVSNNTAEFTKPAALAIKPQQQTNGDSIRDLIVLIEDRLTNYQAAQKATKEAGDAAKLRRLERGTATLQEQLKQARSGKTIDRGDIPPPVITSTHLKPDPTMSHAQSMPHLPKEQAPPPIPPKPSAVPVPVEDKSTPIMPSETSNKDETYALLCQRRDEFRKAALDAKLNGQKETALEYFKKCKQFDKVIEAYEHGQEVDLTGMPTLSQSTTKPIVVVQSDTVAPSATSAPTDGMDTGVGHKAASTVAASVTVSPETMEEGIVDEKAAAVAFKAPPAPSTTLEALQQRLMKYKSAAEEAQREGNASKARRMGRIQKQYEDAIKAQRAGKPVDFEELPTPPGFAPIPLPGNATNKISDSHPTPMTVEKSVEVAHAQSASGKVVPRRASPSPSSAPPAKMSKQEQELKFLLERQQQFKLAALAAKKRGDLNTAKQLLKQALGFDQMINACKNGLRVDISSTPTPPQMKTGAAISKPTIGVANSSYETELATKIPATEGTVLAKAGYEEIFSTLEQDLVHQIQICDRNREFYLNTGDVSKVTTFEHLGSGLKKDLVALRNCFKHGDPPPRFHYETRIFPTIKCFPELGLDDLELSIVRGIHLKLPSGYEPKDADIYVKYDFGYPKETPQSGKTAKIKGSNSPTFDFAAKLKINPKSRQFLHMLKRIGIKFEIYQKGGFLRSDILLGTAEVKLLPLETQPLIHLSLDVIENRKPIGGKLEVKIRVREPLVQKQAEEVKEKWLVIDQFIVPTSASNIAANRAAASAAFGSRQLGIPKVK